MSALNSWQSTSAKIIPLSIMLGCLCENHLSNSLIRPSFTAVTARSHWRNLLHLLQCCSSNRSCTPWSAAINATFTGCSLATAATSDGSRSREDSAGSWSTTSSSLNDYVDAEAALIATKTRAQNLVEVEAARPIMSTTDGIAQLAVIVCRWTTEMSQRPRGALSSYFSCRWHLCAFTHPQISFVGWLSPSLLPD